MINIYEYVYIYIYVYVYVYICIYMYIYYIFICILYIHTSKPILIYVNVLKHQKAHMFCIQVYFGTVFLRKCMFLYERDMLKI